MFFVLYFNIPFFFEHAPNNSKVTFGFSNFFQLMLIILVNKVVVVGVQVVVVECWPSSASSVLNSSSSEPG